MSNHIVVSQRETSWQFSFRGDVAGPFASHSEAVHAAIELARGRTEMPIEVLVQHHDHKTETVWTSASGNDGQSISS